MPATVSTDWAGGYCVVSTRLEVTVITIRNLFDILATGKRSLVKVNISEDFLEMCRLGLHHNP